MLSHLFCWICFAANAFPFFRQPYYTGCTCFAIALVAASIDTVKRFSVIHIKMWLKDITTCSLCIFDTKWISSKGKKNTTNGKKERKKIRCMKCWLLHMCLILWGFNNHINSYQILCGTSFECLSCWQWAKDTNTLLGTVPIGLVIGHQNPVRMSFFPLGYVFFQLRLFLTPSFSSTFFSQLRLFSVLSLFPFSSVFFPLCSALSFFSTSFFLSLCLCIAAL